MVSLGQRIKEQRKAHDMTQEELAAALRNKYGLKTTRPMISKWERGSQEPTINAIKCLADIFGVSIDYLNGAETGRKELSSPSTAINLFDKLGLRPIKLKRFPMLANIHCGEPAYAEQDYGCFVEASADIHADFCLTAQGDSMAGTILPGDIVFIRIQPDVENKEIAAIQIDDEAMLKRVVKVGNQIFFQPDNPAHEIIIPERWDNIRILGKAVFLQRPVK